jgi:hypothetical protein
MPVAAALIGASVTALLYLAREYADRAKSRRVALSTFYYFTHTLAEALHHPVTQMSHVDLAILNEHLPALLAIKNFDTMLEEVHDRYLKWRLSCYTQLPSTAAELHREQQLLRMHGRHANDLLKRNR